MSLFDKSHKYSATTTPLFGDFVVFSGKGCLIKGQIGKEKPRWFLDFAASIGVNALGYGNRLLEKAISSQLRRGILHFSDHDWPVKQAILLKEKLAQVSPGNFPKKVFLCNSGGEAVNAAVKLGFAQRPQRTALLAFKKAFHGRYGYALDLTSSKPIQRKGFPSGKEKVLFLPFPDRDDPSYDFKLWQKKVLGLFQDFPLGKTNAFVFELIQGEGGIRPADPKAIRFLVDHLRKEKVLPIADEVQTGLGRTGKLFACEHYGIEPDVICLAKSLGGGVPIGAIVFRADLDFRQPSRHSTTFGGNPLAAVAALAVLGEVSKAPFLSEVRKKGVFLSGKLKEIAKELNQNKAGMRVSPGGLGLMQKLDFRDKKGKPLAGVRDKIMRRCLEEGLIILSAGDSALRFMPPLVISKKELEKGLEIFSQAAKEILDS